MSSRTFKMTLSVGGILYASQELKYSSEGTDTQIAVSLMEYERRFIQENVKVEYWEVTDED